MTALRQLGNVTIRFWFLAIVLLAAGAVLIATPALASQSPPGTPASVTVTRGDGTLAVSWPAVDGATSYNVNTSDDGKASWARAESGVTGASTTLTGITNSSTYVVAVQAVNANGDSGWRNSASVGPYTPALPPGTPSSVTVTRGDGTLAVSWPAVDGATSYNVNTSDDGKASWARAASGVTGASTTLTGVTNSSSYVVAVQAVNANGGSGWRNSDSVGPYTPPTSPPPDPTPTPTPDPAPTPTPTPDPSLPPATPSSVSVTRSDETLHASWPAVSGATGYHVTFAIASAGDRSWVAAASNHPTNSIDIKHVLNVPSYIVGVRALNSAGGSGWRNSAPTGGYLPPGGLKPLPDMPTSVTITRGDGSLTASWPAANNATSYSVFLKDNSTEKWEDDNWREVALFITETSVTVDANNYLGYTASVRSHNGTGDSHSKDSAESPATETLLPPSYVAVTRGDGTLSASWGPADGAESYHVGWSDNNGASWHRERTSYVGTTIDFTVPVVDNAKSYIVNVMSTIGAVQSVWRYSDVAPPYTTGTPGRPASVTVTRSDGTLTASWSAVANASTYHVSYSSDNKQSWTAAGYGHIGTSIDITGVDNAKTYIVGVRGLNSSGDGGTWRNSAAAGPYTPPTPPAAPENLAAAPGDGFLGITWDAATGATGYDVRVKAQGSNTWNTVASDISGTGYDYVTTQTIDHVGVRARNSGGTSAWVNISRLPSSELLNTANGNAVVSGGLQMAAAMSESEEVSGQSNQVSGQSQLNAPVWGTINRSVNRQRGEIDLNWTHTGWATGFNLVCSDTDGWTWNTCGWDDDGTTTYTSVPTAESRPVTVTHYRRGSDSRHTPGDYDLTRSRHYTVAIRAVNANPPQASEWVSSQIIRPIFPYLRDFTYTRTDGQITMSWTPNPYTTGYNIYCDNYTSGGTYNPSYTLCATLTGQDHTASKHSVTITKSGGTHNWSSLDNTSTLDIAIDSTNATGSARFLTPLMSADETLSVSSVSDTGATLTIEGHTGNWWYKGRVRLGTYGTCTQVTGSTSVTLSTLTASTNYEYHAYSATGCADANLIATAEFRTIAAGSSPALALSNITQTTARVTLANRTGNWWYNYGTRQAGAGACTAAQSGGPNNYVISLSNLEQGTAYSFTAYSDSTCSTQITTIQFSTSAGPALTATGVTDTTATLNLANHTGNWWYQGGSRGGSLSACTQASGTTVSLASLSAGKVHTYGAFSTNTCASSVELDSVTFSTLATLTASNLAATTATLNIADHTAQWWYKADVGPDNTCQGPVAANTATKDLTGLTAGTAYNYKAYSATGCADKNLLSTTATFTTPTS